MQIFLTPQSHHIKNNSKQRVVNTPDYKSVVLMHASKDIVSFSSANVDRILAEKLRNIKNLTCACCGDRMLNEKIFNEFKAKDFEGPALHSLKKLQPYERYMKKLEKSVFRILKKTAAKFPSDDLETIISKRYYYHLGRLEEKQLNILNKMINQNINLSPKSQKKFETTVEAIKNIIFVEPKDKPDKRKRIILLVKSLRNKCSEKQQIEKMIDTINTLPSAKNDIDAFMVKYSRSTNLSIAKRLLKPSLPTLEHIIPAYYNGQDDFGNFLVLCYKCNGERSSMPYTNWKRIHPEMFRKNIQKSIDKIITELNTKRLPEELKESIPKIKENLEKETNGSFILDTTKLKG